MPRPRRLASLNSGAVSLEGISRSKKESISAWSVIHQRGKKVVKVSSGNTTSSQPIRLASRRCATRRSTTSRRVCLRWMGPICAAPTISMTILVLDITLLQIDINVRNADALVSSEAARADQLERLLTRYGPATREIRPLLRAYVSSIVDREWTAMLGDHPEGATNA